MSADAEGFRFRQGAGRLCLDFTRTLRHRGRPDAVEELTGPAAMAAWISQCGPVPARAETKADMTTIRELREAIFALLARGPAECGPGGRELVNRIAQAPVPVPYLAAGPALRWQAADPVAATLSLVARDALDLVTSPAADRVRECANPDCGAMFLDASRPGTRRWCAMGSCGNQAKKTAYRERQAAN
jgi:predicted RNA-binding Zn ribbon-like protein